MINRKGIFLTFMAFLLVSTVITLSISIKQVEIGRGTSTANQAALKEVDSRFRNLRQQIVVTKEGTASAAYGRFMPFNKFEADRNSIELEQNLPIDGEYLKNMYNALNLFAIFAEEKASDGMDFRIQTVLQNSEWDIGSTEEYPKITYAVLPQCMLFSSSKDSYTVDGIDENTVFSKGTQSDGCEQEFEANNVAEYNIEITLPNVIQPPTCIGKFGDCDDLPNNQTTPYAKIRLIWENCATCPDKGFDGAGIKTIAANLSPSGSNSDLITIDIASGDTVSIRFRQPDAPENEILEISTHSDDATVAESTFKATIAFGNTIDEIKLVPGTFDFSVKKPGYEYCKATTDEGCRFKCTTDSECITWFGGDSCKTNIICNTETPRTCEWGIKDTCDLGIDGCCPEGCINPTDTDCSLCGNGIVDSGEDCSTCPQDVTCSIPGHICCYGTCGDPVCESDEDCTDETCENPGTCSAYCAPIYCIGITKCISGDGCCPTGCTYPDDTDCSEDECDTSADCDDFDVCTTDLCSGEPRTCSYSAIIECINSDGCCPAGCSFSEDNDCFEESLIAYYEFEEGSGETVTDSSGSGNTGTLEPDAGTGPQRVPGVCGQGLDFDKSNDYIEASSVVDDVAGGDLTVLMWINSDLSSSQQFIASFNTASGGNSLMLGKQNSLTKLSMYAGGWLDATTSNIYGSSEWHHVGYTLNSGTGGTFWLDGQSDGGFSTTLVVGVSDDFSIGMEYDNASPSDFFSGQIDEVRVYNAALEQAQVEAIYNEEMAGIT